MAKHIPHLFITNQELDYQMLSEDSFHHLINVLRFKKGFEFIVLNNQGLKCKSVITDIKKNNLSFDILEKNFVEKPTFSLNLFQSITKIETFEEILDKSTQLGVSSITPIITENINTSLDIFNKKYIRFNKLIKSATEQSQRAYLPILNPIITLKEFYEKEKNNTIIAYEKSKISLKNIIKDFKNLEAINLLCGTEGGFTDNEAEFLSTKFNLFNLGNNILRSETAVLSALSNINYEFGI